MWQAWSFEILSLKSWCQVQQILTYFEQKRISKPLLEIVFDQKSPTRPYLAA